MANALLASATDDHGTPAAYVEAARYVLGRIDLDPCTSDYWQHHTIKARWHYTAKDDALAERSRFFGTVFMNPPSFVPKKGDPRPRISVRPFYEKLVDHYQRGEVEAAFYVVFNLNQLTVLQSSPIAPLMFPALFPRERGKFLQQVRGGPPTTGEAPTHGNALLLMPTRSSPIASRAMMRRFVEVSENLEIGGSLVRAF